MHNWITFKNLSWQLKEKMSKIVNNIKTWRRSEINHIYNFNLWNLYFVWAQGKVYLLDDLSTSKENWMY